MPVTKSSTSTATGKRSKLVIYVKKARLEARIDLEQLDLLKRVAEMQGRSLTDFVTRTVIEAAQRAIAESEVIHRSAQDQQRFAAALLDPPTPNVAIKKGF